MRAIRNAIAAVRLSVLRALSIEILLRSPTNRPASEPTASWMRKEPWMKSFVKPQKNRMGPR